MRLSKAVLYLTVALAPLFAISDGYAQTVTLLHSFETGVTTNGSYPLGGVIADSSGNFYGTTEVGGANAKGTVYEITSSGTFSVLYSFAGGTGDGQNPESRLVMDSSGNVYGTTLGGGAHSEGVVFELSPGSPWTENILLSFDTTATGSGYFAYDYSGLALDSSGDLYGTTSQGGAHGYGTVFELSPPVSPSTTWTLTVLYDFTGYSHSDGAAPSSGLIWDSSGNLYGTTTSGGTHDLGTVFELSPGTSWTETVLWSFSGTPDGKTPYNGLLMDSSGNLYGTTYSGGTSNNYGTVFELSPGTPWTENILHKFTAGTGDGESPKGVLLMDSSGNLYGTTWSAGAHNEGTVFEINSLGTESLLYSFYAYVGDAYEPGPGGLYMDSSGNLYGDTTSGGAHSDGTVYKLVP